MSRKTDTYVFTGFLESGKTTLIRKVLMAEDADKVLYLSFESGPERIPKEIAPHQFTVRKKDLDDAPIRVAKELGDLLADRKFEKLYIEWNGATHLQKLSSFLQNPMLDPYVKLRSINFVGDGRTLAPLIREAQDRLSSQLIDADHIFLHSVSAEMEEEFVRSVARMNRRSDIYILSDDEDYTNQELKEEIQRKHLPAAFPFLLSLAYIAIFYLAIRLLLPHVNSSADQLLSLMTGTLLQAIPFLLLGVLLSSLIQTYIPQSLIEKHFPRNPLLGFPFAVLMGFCLPVCDCASIPVFRSLLRKGIPLPAAVVFMAVSPIINPIVLWSTYIAFGGNWHMVIARSTLGILFSFLLGGSFLLWKVKHPLDDGVFSSRSCSTELIRENTDDTPPAPGARFFLFLRHAELEFLSVGAYLILGAFFAALFQTLGLFRLIGGKNVAFLPALLFMMLSAFLLSLCSSSDAVIARSLSLFIPLDASLGFLVLGPVMDIKNLLMLKVTVSKSMTRHLFFRSIVFAFLVVAVFHYLGFGGMLR